MTHEERVWELYNGFVIGDFNNCQIPTDYGDGYKEESKEYHDMAEAFATEYEELSKEGDHGRE